MLPKKTAVTKENSYMMHCNLLSHFLSQSIIFFFLFENTLSNFYFHTNYYFHTWDIHLLLAVMIFEPRAKYILSYSTIYSDHMCTCKLSKWTCVLLLLFFGGGGGFFCWWWLFFGLFCCCFWKRRSSELFVFNFFPSTNGKHLRKI